MAGHVVLLLVSLIVLVIGAEVLVRGAAAMAVRLGVSSFFIGLTIVGFGTSTPELFTSVTAALENRGDIAVGNVVGSNIFNIAVILGLSAVIRPIPIRVRLVRGEVLLVIGVALVPLIGALTGDLVSRAEGAVMTALLLLYVWRGYVIGRREGRDADRIMTAEIAEATALPRRRWSELLIVQLLLIAAGLALLVFGARWLVDSSVAIARVLGISELAIGLTIVAAGTSMPELATSLVAAIRRQPDISVGNVLGSNIFNILGILGLTCVIEPQSIPRQVFWLDVPVMIAVSVACLPFMLSAHRISRTEGVVLLGGFTAYTVVLLRFAPGWFG